MNVREKLKLQKVVREGIEKLKEKLPIREKLALQKEVRLNLEKLGKGVKAEQPAANTPVFDALVKGDFDNLEVMEYIEKVKLAYTEIDDLVKLEAPAERYIQKHANKDGVGEQLATGLGDIPTKPIGEKKSDDENQKESSNCDNDSDDQDNDDSEPDNKKGDPPPISDDDESDETDDDLIGESEGVLKVKEDHFVEDPEQNDDDDIDEIDSIGEENDIEEEDDDETEI